MGEPFQLLYKKVGLEDAGLELGAPLEPPSSRRSAQGFRASTVEPECRHSCGSGTVHNTGLKGVKGK